MLRFSVRDLSPHHPDVLRSFRRRSPEDSAAGSCAPPGSHAAPPAGNLRKGQKRKAIWVLSCARTLNAP